MSDFGAKYDRAFQLLGAEADALLIVPPFADLYHASLGVHLLQAVAEKAGLQVRVLYANLLFAAVIGEEGKYQSWEERHAYGAGTGQEADPI